MATPSARPAQGRVHRLELSVAHQTGKAIQTYQLNCQARSCVSKTTVYDTPELIANKSRLLHDRTEGWCLPAGAEEGSGCSPVKPLALRCSASLRPYGVTGGYPQKGMSSSSCSAMPVGRPRSDGPEPGAGGRWPVSPPKSSGDPISVPPPSRAPPRSVSSPRKRDSTTSVVERSCPPWSVHLRVWSWPST